ncbi:hypothetical protein [Agarivorans sp. 1_MG-2023]|uniref:hypothetical protein n=1 Tax=Agarivorans sp. 1_MG-2023 TaxID=3062634 RepID=UPI0026E495C8|nr:hypothetical protein [Agarivorans sp. 1_MG-2023]MDO6764068.1 hypothetical protein [Agarivorans sp. 1_MG-2023]
MTVVITLALLTLIMLAPIKIGTQVLKIERSGMDVCFIAVILAIAAGMLTDIVIGQGFFPTLVAIVVTSILFSLLFKTTAVAGFVLALLSTGIQLLFTVAIVAFGVAIAYTLS